MPPPDPEWQAGYVWRSGGAYGATPIIVNCVGWRTVGDDYYGTTAFSEDDCGFVGSVTAFKEECPVTGQEGLCLAEPPLIDEWPADGCTNLAV